MSCKEQLTNLLQSDPRSNLVPTLIKEFELNSNVDLKSDVSLLKGVWELRWSSSTQPWLKQASWLENLQILDPEQKKGVQSIAFKCSHWFCGGYCC